MMVHSTDTTIADPAMMRKGRFESLALSTHGVARKISPLALHRNSTFWYGPWIR
jgi:hypothetical protein